MKKKISITLDEEVLVALTAQQSQFETDARAALRESQKTGVYQPIRYSRSAVVQMALLKMFAVNGIMVLWPGRIAMDLTTGLAVPIPDNAEIQEESGR